MATIWRDRIQQTVSAVASAGVGAFTLSTASTGYQALGSGDDGKVGSFVAYEGSSKWQTFLGIYTHSGTSLARTTPLDGSAGVATNETFTSAAIVLLDVVATIAANFDASQQSVVPSGCLTLTTGVPKTLTDVTGATTIYFTPFRGNTIRLWDGNRWTSIPFAETSLALGTLTSGKPYDVFGFLSSGALALEVLVWTNDTTRATAVTYQDGRVCKSGAKDRLLLGSFYTTSTTTTENSQAKRYLSNVYNDDTLSLFICPGYVDDNAVTSYSVTNTTWAPVNGGTNAAVSYLLTLGGAVHLGVTVCGDGNVSGGLSAGLGDNSTTGVVSEAPSAQNTRLIATFPRTIEKAAGRYTGNLLALL